MAGSIQSRPASCSLDKAPGLGLNTLVVVVVVVGELQGHGQVCFGRDVGSRRRGKRNIVSAIPWGKADPCGNSEEDRSGVSKGFPELQTPLFPIILLA